MDTTITAEEYCEIINNRIDNNNGGYLSLEKKLENIKKDGREDQIISNKNVLRKLFGNNDTMQIIYNTPTRIINKKIENIYDYTYHKKKTISDITNFLHFSDRTKEYSCDSLCGSCPCIWDSIYCCFMCLGCYLCCGERIDKEILDERRNKKFSFSMFLEDFIELSEEKENFITKERMIRIVKYFNDSVENGFIKIENKNNKIIISK